MIVQPTTIEKMLQSPHFNGRWMAKWITAMSKFRAAEGLLLAFMEENPIRSGAPEMAQKAVGFKHEYDKRALQRCLKYLRRQGLITVKYLGTGGERWGRIYLYRML